MAKIIGTTDTSSYVRKKFTTYADFKNQIPVECSYYSVALSRSNASINIYSIDEVLGSNTPLKFNKIDKFPLYDLSLPPEIESGDTENNFDTDIEGTATIIKPTDEPKIDDIFILKNSDDDEVLYRVNNVVRNRLNLDAHYKITFYKYKILDDVLKDKLSESSIEFVVNTIASEKHGSVVYLEKPADIELNNLLTMFQKIQNDYIDKFYDRRFEAVRVYLNRRTLKFDKSTNDTTLHYFVDFKLNKFLRDTKLLSKNALFNKEATFYRDIYDTETVSGDYYHYNMYNKDSHNDYTADSRSFVIFTETPNKAVEIFENPFKLQYATISYLDLIDNHVLDMVPNDSSKPVLHSLDGNLLILDDLPEDYIVNGIQNIYLKSYVDYMKETYLSLELLNTFKVTNDIESFMFTPFILHNLDRKIDSILLTLQV